MPKDNRCPKCKSTNTYLDDENTMACLKCGERFPYVQAAITKQEKIEMSEQNIPPSGKKGTCINCGRDRWIANKYGHCTTCASAVKCFKFGTDEFGDALTAVAKRIQENGDTKFKKAAKRLRTRVKERMAEVKQLPPEKKATKQLANITVTDMMIAERDMLLERVHKLNSAIELLS